MKPIRFESFVAVFALAAALGVPKAAEGADAFTWMSASPGNWTTVANWDNGSTYPHTSSDDARFASAATVTVDATGISLHALVVDGADSAVLTGAGKTITLTDDNPMWITDGRLVIDGGLCVKSSSLGWEAPIGFSRSGSARPEVCVTNASQLIFSGSAGHRAPSSGRILATGSGSSFSITGRAVGDASRIGSDMIYEADDGGVITLGNSTSTKDYGMAWGAAAASDLPVKYIARNGGTVKSSVVGKQTYIAAGPAEVLLQNGGVFSSSRTSSNNGSGMASAWRIEIDDAKYTDYTPLLHNNEVVFKHSYSGSSVVSSGGPFLNDSSSTNNTFTFQGATVTGDLPIKLTGTDNTYLVIDATVTTSGSIAATDTSALNTKLVFRGTTPVLRGTNSGGTTLGYSSKPTKYPVIRFEPEGDGFTAAPFEPSNGKASALYEYLPIEIDLLRMSNKASVTVPLITWTKGFSGTKPTAEAIQSHLSEDALPLGCTLVWQDNTLCVEIPPATSTGHGLIWRLEPKAKN